LKLGILAIFGACHSTFANNGWLTHGRSRHRWEDNIIMDLSEIEWVGVVWIHLAEDRDQRQALVNTVMKLRVLKSKKFLDYISDY
jgi:hypothetical protein